ncbi:hypothetical protein CP98_03643 [Sphingobium yanoikuyae]|uniref:Uncharacterized protein n=1 Tax=Sphingobium yanoikuyae TaxID=13690 RepID=A0A084EGQ3_SPHYA|nr:hypothetical protein [Sphingobium yanoikuyae]KEZ17145.1 hypothetical protein CP98_03643 [Sphingobium yanoikuyae]
MPDDQSMALMLGEMRGQLRELVHQVANLAQKFEDVAKTADATKHLPDLITDNKTKIAALEVRVTALEAVESERRGAVKLSGWLIKTVPFASLGAGAVLAAKLLGVG